MTRSLFLVGLAAIYAAQTSAAPAGLSSGLSDASASAPLPSASGKGASGGHGKAQDIPQECIQFWVKNMKEKHQGEHSESAGAHSIKTGHGPVSTKAKSGGVEPTPLVSGSDAAGADPTGLSSAAGADASASLAVRQALSSSLADGPSGGLSADGPEASGASKAPKASKSGEHGPASSAVPSQCVDWMKDIEEIAKEIKDSFKGGHDNKSQKGDGNGPKTKKGGASSAAGADPTDLSSAAGADPTGLSSAAGAEPSGDSPSGVDAEPSSDPSSAVGAEPSDDGSASASGSASTPSSSDLD